MITPPPARRGNFNEDYAILGEYVTDDQRVPYLNPSDSDVMIEPGEPLLVQWGASGAAECMMAQGPIFPDEIGMLVRYFTGDFPCNLSADVVFGAELYWDADNKVVSLAADVTNGFVIGYASWHIDPLLKQARPAVDGSGRVICGTTTSTKIRVVSTTAAATVKGAVTPRSIPAPAPAAASKSSKSSSK